MAVARGERGHEGRTDVAQRRTVVKVTQANVAHK